MRLRYSDVTPEKLYLGRRELMAGAILGSVPIVVLYVFFLDYYVSGLTAGAVK